LERWAIVGTLGKRFDLERLPPGGISDEFISSVESWEVAGAGLRAQKTKQNEMTSVEKQVYTGTGF